MTLATLFHPNNSAPVAASAASCVVAFDIHAVLGVAGQVAAILSGLLSAAWVGYQFYQSRHKK